MIPSAESHHTDAASFRTTHWSIVLAAANQASPSSQEALARLCETYWYPLYAYVRRRGHTPQDAEDLTQEFFARLLDKEYLADITQEGGRFRSYLLTMVKRFLANEWERARTQKRGGGKALISLDEEDPESRYKFEPADPATPEALFERRWALTVLDQVMLRLRNEYITERKGEWFAQLQPLLSGDKQSLRYAEVGAALGLSEGAVKVAVHRLRKRYGQLLRDEIGQTVASTAEIEDEIRCLISAASR